MAWKTMDVREQRVKFVVAALRRERSLSSLCREFEISRPTGRLWLERYRAGGVEAIAERSRRPPHSPRHTAPELERSVVELRRRYPDWGARKLQVLLGDGGIQLPASTIHRILLRYRLVHEDDRHPPAPQRFERAAPNELWQIAASKTGERSYQCVSSKNHLALSSFERIFGEFSGDLRYR